jgi:AraC family L-rhamnose operon regulatory protein RhaS
LIPTALQRFSLANLDHVYYAEDCEPLVAASRDGTIELQVLARDDYHGKSIPADEIAAVKHLGYWDAKVDQNWGLPWHRN